MIMRFVGPRRKITSLSAAIAVVLIYVVLSPARTSAATKDGGKVNFEVRALLSKMTLEEKIGQMTQLTIQAVSITKGPEAGQLDTKKLEEAIVKYHVGSLLNAYDSSLSVGDWDNVITRIQDVATKETRLKIPILYGIDAIHGETYTKGATLFPQPLNMAATFNKRLAEREGAITALETRASGIPWIFYPVLDLARQPLWSRVYETFGEDPYLSAQMGANYIRGAQGDDIGAPDKVATCLKHYVGYSFPLDGKDRTPAWIPRRMMKEMFLPPFEKAVKAGAPTVMCNSSEVNGIPGDANYYLLTKVLRGEMKFKGFVVSDWGDIENLYKRFGIASSPEEAVRIAVMAGVDMSMVPSDYSFYDLLLKLVKEGKVPMWRINQAVSRILAVKFELGLFKNPYPDRGLEKGFASASSDSTNLQAAEESITLVKNADHFLPLAKNMKVLVSGPTANLLSTMNGGWTITWQGNVESLYPADKRTPLKAIEDEIGKSNVTFLPGASYDSLIDLDSAVRAAKNVDAVILFLGEHTYAETPGNINDLTLPEAQLKLAEAMIATGKPVVVVMLEGRPRIIDRIVGGSKSILVAFLPGMDGGEALANIIFGDANPSAKLPITYPRYVNALYHYDHTLAEVQGGNVFEPQWNFGHGLSYTTFKYSDLTLDAENVKKGKTVTATVKVTNTGKMAGEHAVLLYLGQKYRQVTHPVDRLEGFEKVSLQPGEAKLLKFVISPEQMSFIGIDNERIIEPGVFRVSVGDLSKEFTVTGKPVDYFKGFSR